MPLLNLTCCVGLPFHLSIVHHFVRDIEVEVFGDSIHEVHGEALKAVISGQFLNLFKKKMTTMRG